REVERDLAYATAVLAELGHARLVERRATEDVEVLDELASAARRGHARAHPSLREAVAVALRRGRRRDVGAGAHEEPAVRRGAEREHADVARLGPPEEALLRARVRRAVADHDDVPGMGLRRDGLLRERAIVRREPDGSD